MNTKLQKTINKELAIARGLVDNMIGDEQKEADEIVEKQIKEDDLNIKGSAKRYNQGKTQLDLIPPNVLEELGRALTYGAEKYGKYNYRKGMEWSKVLDSLLRHINSFRKGEDFDIESGLPHLSLAMCNIVFLSEYSRIYPQGRR